MRTTHIWKIALQGITNNRNSLKRSCELSYRIGFNWSCFLIQFSTWKLLMYFYSVNIQVYYPTVKGYPSIQQGDNIDTAKYRKYRTSSLVLKFLQCSEHPPVYWIPFTVLDTLHSAAQTFPLAVMNILEYANIPWLNNVEHHSQNNNSRWKNYIHNFISHHTKL